MSNHLISIIIPIRYRADLTRACIDSVLNYTKDFELILVQEGEDEEISALLKTYRVKQAHNIVPKGYSGALNAGIAKATGDYYCFLNNDTVVVPGWMDKMMLGFKDNVGLVVPTFGGTTVNQNVDWSKNIEFEEVENPFSIMGVCFLVKKEVMDKIGLWDENFFFGGEDWDIAHRILQAGYRIVIARDAYIYHYCGASAKEYLKNNNDKLFEKIQNNIKQIEDKHNIKFYNYGK